MTHGMGSKLCLHMYLSTSFNGGGWGGMKTPQLFNRLIEERDSPGVCLGHKTVVFYKNVNIECKLFFNTSIFIQKQALLTFSKLKAGTKQSPIPFHLSSSRGSLFHQQLGIRGEERRDKC